ncbi:hypothetical protein FOPE_01692 [Fonsecaea pedrosoi]|nr:hypothetical protein FOPE_01692 [Fonsecaea pedrosoi]
MASFEDSREQPTLQGGIRVNVWGGEHTKDIVHRMEIYIKEEDEEGTTGWICFSAKDAVKESGSVRRQPSIDRCSFSHTRIRGRLGGVEESPWGSTES